MPIRCPSTALFGLPCWYLSSTSCIFSWTIQFWYNIFVAFLCSSFFCLSLSKFFYFLTNPNPRNISNFHIKSINGRWPLFSWAVKIRTILFPLQLILFRNMGKASIEKALPLFSKNAGKRRSTRETPINLLCLNMIIIFSCALRTALLNTGRQHNQSWQTENPYLFFLVLLQVVLKLLISSILWRN